MAKKGSFSKVYDKNGDYVDVEAARFDGTRTFQMQGDVSATQTWNGDSASALTLNTSIGAKKVTTDKINDKAVQTGQIDDGAVGLTQIATAAMNGTVQDNDSKLATHAAVKTYVDSQISGQGTYLGKHTVAEINAMVTDNLHNGDRVMTSDSGTINLGPGGVGFDVEAGEDLILYKSGSTVQWDSMDGNFKTKQTAVDDPTASGTGLTFIDSISQDENGEITPSKKTVQDGTTSQKGVVQLEDSHSSTSTTKAATPNSVKEAYDLANTANSGLENKQDKPSSATENNIATFNGSKSTKDSGKAFLPSTSTWNGTSDDKVPTAKAVQARLNLKADADKAVAIADAYVLRRGQVGNGWYKLAETTMSSYNYNVNSVFDIFVSGIDVELFGTLIVDVRDGVPGSRYVIYEKNLYSDKWSTDYPVKLVVSRPSSYVHVELWCAVKPAVQGSVYSGLSVSERNAGNYGGTNKKNSWTYQSYVDRAGSAEPVSDIEHNIEAVDVIVENRQLAIASPTDNNLVAMDANGLVKDSGLTKSSVESAITSAGSAIQGVKVNNTTLTPDSNKVVTVPLATTSADGAMSAADKTKLNGIAEGAEVNVQADWNVTDSSSDAYIKNKPYRSIYNTTETLYKVCTGTIDVGGGGLAIMARSSNGVIYGELAWRDSAKLFLHMVDGNYASTQSAKLYVKFSQSSVNVYVRCGNYSQFKAAPLINNPKSVVNFDDFGQVIESLPEGATEITPVWVANSASSSGTAPVKVDEYGALTPVPMDSTPTASSTNLMTSGDIKTALDGKQDSLSFMTTAEAQSLWQNAKNAVAAS